MDAKQYHERNVDRFAKDMEQMGQPVSAGWVKAAKENPVAFRNHITTQKQIAKKALEAVLQGPYVR